MNSWKNIVGFFFFSVLMLIKISAFHVFTHHHEHEDDSCVETCVVCDMALDSQQSVHTQPEAFVFKPQINLVSINQTFDIKEIFVLNQRTYSNFSRPPPSLHT